MHGNAQPMLKDLNFVRDAYRQSLPYPLVLVLPKGAMVRLARFAPDFWAWQSGWFAFETLPQRVEAAQSRLAEFSRTTRNENSPNRQERIELLQRLLMEVETGNGARSRATTINRRDLVDQLGVAWYHQGDWGRAEDCFREALQTSEALDDRYSIAFDLGWLGHIERNRGNWDAAERLYRRSLELREELGDRSGMARSIGGLGENELGRGNLDEAEALLIDARDRFEKLGDRQYIAECNFRLAQLWQQRGNGDRARQHLQTARDLFARLGAVKDLERCVLETAPEDNRESPEHP